MALTKKDGVWYYDFWFQKRRYQASTLQKSIEKARMVEAKIKTDIKLGTFGIAAPKLLPTFQEFADGEFTQHVALNNKDKPRTIQFYTEKMRRLLEFKPFAEARLNEIDERMIEQYKQVRASQKRKSRGEGKIGVGAINTELRTLRKALRLAYRFQLLPRIPSIQLLSGEVNRSYVLTGEIETLYLAKAEYPLKHAVILLLDLGLRVDELLRAEKIDVMDNRLYVRDGKTGAREIPLPPRSVETLNFLWELWPDSPWIFPSSRRKGKHLTISGLDNLHFALRAALNLPTEFVLYSCRHTFGTRLAESGANPWDIKKLMGHSSIKTSERYIHTGYDSVERAMRRKEEFDNMLRGSDVHEEVSSKKM